MKYRSALLMAGEDVGSAGTKVIDIDVQSPISALDIKFKITRGSDTHVAGVAALLPKIEIVDGAKVLYSANGYLNQALGYYNRPTRQLEHGQVITANSEVGIFPIDFGRRLWDKELAFDPKRFTNPQLRISHSELATDASASANELEVTAHLFDEKAINPIGFLAGMLHHDYTCGANNSFESISLPDDRMIRQILVRAFYQGYEPWYNIDEARLDENTLGNIVFDETNLEEYFRRMQAYWSPIQIYHIWNVSTTVSYKYIPQTNYWAGVVSTTHSHETTGNIQINPARGGKIGVDSEAAGEWGAISHGYLPWHTYQFPMGDPADLEDWYDPIGKKPRLRLRASSGATSVTGQVLLEELVRY